MRDKGGCCDIRAAFSRICFFFNDTATTEIYTLSLHDALPILGETEQKELGVVDAGVEADVRDPGGVLQVGVVSRRSEEHTSELQSHSDLVCRLLLEKKKKKFFSPCFRA